MSDPRVIATKYTLIDGVELARHRDRIALFVESGRGPFEPETLEVWRDLCRGQAGVVDVGAYTGLFSIVAALEGVEEVYAIEPNPKACHRIRHNLRHNGVKDQVDVVEAAVSAFAGEGHLEVGDERGGICSTSQLQEGKGTPVTTLDDIVQAWATAPIGAVKIDVEGHELAVLSGAVYLLEEEHPPLIVEVSSRSGGDRKAEIIAYLSTFDYAEPERLLDGRNLLFEG